MERANRILNHNLFLKHMHLNDEAEADRCFCLHNMNHFLDVARISMILNLKENLCISPDIIYAAALLHDIGRHVQYENGTSHELASAEIAPSILKDCGFDNKETGVIIDAISHHRAISEGESQLSRILYQADKASRPCFACKVEKDCNWKKEKKNLQIKW
ncbi:MAG TPA: HD domain-containing protein [Lachnospiraceae bacterium]|nr:HD domain-containing protein [Lachnospiraceae bacterium]